MHHDAIEFLGNLLKHYGEYILDIADYFQIKCINRQCFNSCSAISGYRLLGQYYLDVAVPNSKAALTLESLLYNWFFSNLNQSSERLRCESFNGIEAHKVMIYRNAPPVLIIHLSRNKNAENLTSKSIRVPLVLYFDNFFTSGNIKCPGNVQRGDIYDLVMGTNVTGSIISSFLNVLKVNDVILRPCAHYSLRVCSIKKELPILLNM